MIAHIYAADMIKIMVQKFSKMISAIQVIQEKQDAGHVCFLQKHCVCDGALLSGLLLWTFCTISLSDCTYINIQSVLDIAAHHGPLNSWSRCTSTYCWKQSSIIQRNAGGENTKLFQGSNLLVFVRILAFHCGVLLSVGFHGDSRVRSYWWMCLCILVSEEVSDWVCVTQ